MLRAGQLDDNERLPDRDGCVSSQESRDVDGLAAVCSFHSLVGKENVKTEKERGGERGGGDVVPRRRPLPRLTGFGF